MQDWCQHLLNPNTSLQVTLAGAPGMFVAPERWRVLQPPLNQHLLYYVVEGGFIAQVQQQPIEVVAGSVFWLRPGNTPNFNRLDSGRLILYRFRLQVVDYSWIDPFLHLPDQPDCRRWFEFIIHELNLHHDTLRLRALLVCLFTEFDPQPSLPIHKGQRQLTRYEQAQITQLITAQPQNHRLSPTDLAKVVGLSSDYFARVFRNTFGTTPRRWLVEQRIEYAKTFLAESDMTVSEIADKLGYSDVYFFSHQFKSIVGSSPLQFRHGGQLRHQ